ncbi:putative transcription factor C2H2 family [Medicago truncatula]|uniref:Putative transcription factor C2H2 family n=1 Tax=Medicago truncatula TaxID=3880 RepID=A0A072TYR6_MEDTR|nr:zinc finger protein 1 [Medicago truncatula]KEH21993.1 zinc finger protein [Medicago truncatula]RHN44960.1 putative transcription factor C2H2 family [Medicago truncatula]
MCNKGKDKVNEESVANLKMMVNQNNEKKRKAIMLEESDVETQNSKTPLKDVAEEESTDSSKKISPFLLFGFIVDHRKAIKNAYSCKFCSRKFTSPQALGGHQSSHKLERSLKKMIQGISLNTITPFHMGCGYQCYGFNNMIQHGGSSNLYAGNLYGAFQHISEIDEANEADQSMMSQKVIVSKIEVGKFSEGGAVSDEVDREDKETQEEEASKIDLTLKL